MGSRQGKESVKTGPHPRPDEGSSNKPVSLLPPGKKATKSMSIEKSSGVALELYSAYRNGDARGKKKRINLSSRSTSWDTHSVGSQTLLVNFGVWPHWGRLERASGFQEQSRANSPPEKPRHCSEGPNSKVKMGQFAFLVGAPVVHPKSTRFAPSRCRGRDERGIGPLRTENRKIRP